MCSAYADSSHGNAEHGRSFGGFVLLCEDPTLASPPPGGAFAWKVEAPPEGDDSSAAAELRMLARAVKYTVAVRTIQRDLALGIGPTAPTALFTDAAAVLSGKGGERMTKSTRWLATRYAMLRWAEASRTVRLAKVAAADNPADIMTKCLVGPAFVRHRARVLGLPSPL